MKNLFELATKELSQDAFLRWLFENYDSDNPHVREAAYTLLRSFTGLKLPDGSIFELQTYAQVHSIDVIVTFCSDEKRYLVAIEDKVFCGEHDNQLRRYREILLKTSEFLGRPYDEAFFVFYKTDIENKDDSKAAKEAGWATYYIKEIHELFSCLSKSTGSEILDQYHAFIESRYEKMSNLSSKSVKDWDLLDFRTYFLKEIVPEVEKNIPKVLDKWYWGNWQGQYFSLLLSCKCKTGNGDCCGLGLELLPRPYFGGYHILVRAWSEGDKELSGESKEILRTALIKDGSVFRPRNHKWCIATASKPLEERLQFDQGTESHTAALKEIVQAFVDFCKEH